MANKKRKLLLSIRLFCFKPFCLYEVSIVFETAALYLTNKYKEMKILRGFFYVHEADKKIVSKHSYHSHWK